MSNVRCCACGKHMDELFQIGDRHVCFECVKFMSNYIEDKKKPKEPIEATLKKQETPRQLIAKVDEMVVKQTEAKKALAIAIAQHLRRICSKDVSYKTNVLVFGPTGTGKTELARAFSKAVNLPFVVTDCSQYSPTGYIGESASSCIERLLIESNFDVELTEKGIIFLDEFDKLGDTDEKGTFKTKSVQQELLKIIEGTKVLIKHPGTNSEYNVDTSKILFIAAGAFPGLKEIATQVDEKRIGIMSDSKIIPFNGFIWQQGVKTEHFEKYGFLPEILGRFPVVTYTEELKEEDFVGILKQSLGPVAQISKLLEVDKIKVALSDELLSKLAKKSLKSGLGARALRAEIERVLQQVYLSLDEYEGQEIVINENEEIVTKTNRSSEVEVASAA